jgi:hypothetical protein
MPSGDSILLLPFAVTFVDGDKAVDGQKVKDPDLKSKLVNEYRASWRG